MLELKDGKNPFCSKTVWAGLMIAGVGVLSYFGINIPTELVISIASGLGIVGLRDAITQ